MSYHWRPDHFWYRVQYAFWMMQRCGFRVTPAFVWDQATCWDWDADYTVDGPQRHVDEEMSYWEPP